ncbi:hypothetical protein Ciccas_008550 [Cichlidogyrus casuarinus]|uniref:Uncharacterized protein n=1 Tax=Cichlidogyrus casuarinus TaxID=1844966 RepID=A0ABD2PZZ7_9PLAT
MFQDLDLDINIPYSPCINVQHVLRNGQLICIPSILLVQSDVVQLRPCQIVHFHCKTIVSLFVTLFHCQNSEKLLKPGDEIVMANESSSQILTRQRSSPVFAEILEPPLQTLTRELKQITSRMKDPILLYFVKKGYIYFTALNFTITVLNLCMMALLCFHGLAVHLLLKWLAFSLFTNYPIHTPLLWIVLSALGTCNLATVHRNNEAQTQSDVQQNSMTQSGKLVESIISSSFSSSSCSKIHPLLSETLPISKQANIRFDLRGRIYSFFTDFCTFLDHVSISSRCYSFS